MTKIMWVDDDGRPTGPTGGGSGGVITPTPKLILPLKNPNPVDANVMLMWDAELTDNSGQLVEATKFFIYITDDVENANVIYTTSVTTNSYLVPFGILSPGQAYHIQIWQSFIRNDDTTGTIKGMYNTVLVKNDNFQIDFWVNYGGIKTSIIDTNIFNSAVDVYYNFNNIQRARISNAIIRPGNVFGTVNTYIPIVGSTGAKTAIISEDTTFVLEATVDGTAITRFFSVKYNYTPLQIVEETFDISDVNPGDHTVIFDGIHPYIMKIFPKRCTQMSIFFYFKHNNETYGIQQANILLNPNLTGSQDITIYPKYSDLFSLAPKKGVSGSWGYYAITDEGEQISVPTVEVFKFLNVTNNELLGSLLLKFKRMFLIK